MSKYDVTVAEYPAKRLIGMKIKSAMAAASADCPALWDAFGPRMGELAASVSGPAGSFGVSVMLNAEDFDYWAAMEVTASAPAPQGMAAMELRAGLYAKVAVPNLEKLGEAFTYLYGAWGQEQADYVCDETAPCYEWYPANWQPSEAFEIFAAVKKR
ncbi:MAG: GyrI-like domain-containing protein [Candidatus Adiutrix sp.]|jgi:AraC family transcriptional regulator|nr:GyrI-like domain-containing protein [Candidatus Adiutrix sp.]